jgi:hypothetical protein
VRFTFCLSLPGQEIIALECAAIRSRNFDRGFEKLDLNGDVVPYLAPEDLIPLKEASWREQDQIDVAALKKSPRELQ